MKLQPIWPEKPGGNALASIFGKPSNEAPADLAGETPTAQAILAAVSASNEAPADLAGETNNGNTGQFAVYAFQ